MGTGFYPGGQCLLNQGVLHWGVKQRRRGKGWYNFKRVVMKLGELTEIEGKHGSEGLLKL